MPDISKLTMSNGVVYNIKDTVAREMAKNGGSSKKIIELTIDEDRRMFLPANLGIMDFVGAIIYSPNNGYDPVVHVYDKVDPDGEISIRFMDSSGETAYIYTYMYRPETGELVKPM